MGQKVHPGGFRIGVIQDWKSHWYTEKEFGAFLAEDRRIRSYIMRRLSNAGISRIVIRKDQTNITIDIHTARPGIVIGKSGSEVDALRKELFKMTQKNVQVNIIEVKRPELDAALVAQSIAEQLENRVSFRRAMKRALTSAMRSGAVGMRVRCGGRLGGAEMSRSEHYSEGKVPLHTLRADIDYGFREARTTFGRIGVKVWVNRGELSTDGRLAEERREAQERREAPRRDRRGGRPGGRPGGPRRDRPGGQRGDRQPRAEQQADGAAASVAGESPKQASGGTPAEKAAPAQTSANESKTAAKPSGEQG